MSIHLLDLTGSTRALQEKAMRYLHMGQVVGLENCLQRSAVLGRQRGAAPNATWQRGDARSDAVVTSCFSRRRRALQPV